MTRAVQAVLNSMNSPSEFILMIELQVFTVLALCQKSRRVHTSRNVLLRLLPEFHGLALASFFFVRFIMGMQPG